LTGPSVLFPDDGDRPSLEAPERPAFFRDANIDQIVSALVVGRERYDLEPFFYFHPKKLETVNARQEVFRDLGNADTLSAIRDFARIMHTVHECRSTANRLRHPSQKKRWHLEEALRWCEATRDLSDRLAATEPRSEPLAKFAAYLKRFVDDALYRSFSAEAENVQRLLSDVQYTILLQGDTVTVARREEEANYSEYVVHMFDRFRQANSAEYRYDFSEWTEMNHVEEYIVEAVERLEPDAFGALDAFCAAHETFLDPVVLAFEREIQFYLAMLEYIEPIRARGLSFCIPVLAEDGMPIYATESFDLALAAKLSSGGETVVPNDFTLGGNERVFVVSGPNQGGKTTFARMFAQLHYLAGIGAPVPGSSARLRLYDCLFTHFESEESAADARGKLVADLEAIRATVAAASARSVVVMNELFNSTTLPDALFLGRKIMERITGTGCLCVCVTFIDELSTLNDRVVSLVSAIEPGSGKKRTYRIERRAADGKAYAVAVAEKWGLSGDRLRERLK